MGNLDSWWYSGLLTTMMIDPGQRDLKVGKPEA